jgi:glycosyltransferase involved in cell wall biosynthesis
LDLGIVDYTQFATYFSRQECDIFIAPLQDNLFNRCKSWIKFLEYSALAVPGVYSRIAPYEHIIRHGENGYLASDPDEWEEHLIRLIEDPALRRQLGLAAQVTLQKDWLLSGRISEWKSTFQDMISSAPQSKDREPARQIARKFYTWHLDSQSEVETLNAKLAQEVQKTQLLKRRLDEKDYLLQIYNRQLEAISNSTGWRLLEALYRIRLKIAPRDSYREHLMQLAIQSLRILKNEGVRSLASKWLTSLRSRNTQAILGKEAASNPPPITVVVNDQPCPSPAISVIIEDISLLPQIDPQEVLAWVGSQTLKSVELVLWHRSTDNAQVIACQGSTTEARTWNAPDLPALIRELGGRYLCMASNDLLQQSQTYLECNLVALEGEGLVFTVNTLGASGWATRLLPSRCLPGDRLRPLFRQIVHKEYVKSDYSLDLSLWAQRMDGLPSIAGKVIPHTSNTPEIGESFPMETPTGNVEATLQGKHIVVRTRPDLSWETARVYRSIDSVMPSSRQPSDLPTVFLAMTFLAVGGAEQLALNLINGLKDKIRFVVLGTEELDPALGTLSDAFRHLTPLVYNMADCSDLPSRLSFLCYLIDRYQPVSLYIANGSTWLYDALADIKKRYPDLWTVNQVYDYQAGWINRYDPGLLLYMDAHIGANERICQAYIEKGARPEQVHLIEHGIDPNGLNPEAYTYEDIYEIKSKLGLPQDSRVVTFASRIHPQKRPMDFVELARRFSSDPSIVFLMLGDGPLTGTVEEQVARIGLKNFYRKPFYRPIADILAISDVVVLPSEYEGMPLIIAEAQVMGKPVVVTDVGNNRQVLEMTGGGVVVPRIGDIEGLANGVRQMMATPPDSVRVQQALLAHFGIQVIAEQYHKVLVRHTDA